MCDLHRLAPASSCKRAREAVQVSFILLHAQLSRLSGASHRLCVHFSDSKVEVHLQHPAVSATVALATVIYSCLVPEVIDFGARALRLAAG